MNQPTASGMPHDFIKSSSSTLELLALAVFPIFLAGNKLISFGLFAFYICSKTLKNRELLIAKSKSHIPSCFIIGLTTLYIISKGSLDQSVTWHALSDSTLYPVTIADYLIFFLLPVLISILPISTLELLVIALSFAFSALLHLFVAMYFEGGVKLLTIGSWPPLFHIQPGWKDASRRVAGFVNPNILAFFAVSTSLISIGILKSAATGIKLKKLKQISNWLLLIILIIGLAGLLASSALVIWSGSRASLGVFILSIIAITILYRARIAAGLLLVITALLGLQISGKLQQIGINLPGVAFNRITAMIGNFQSTDAERIKIFSCFWKQSLEAPFTGQGIFNSTENCERLANYPKYGFNHGHNLFLQTASELGFPVTVVILGGMVWLVYRGMRPVLSIKNNPSLDTDIRISFLLAAVAGIILSMTSLAIFHWYPLLLMCCLFLGAASAPLKSSDDGR
jgi:O-antigen ligase